LPIMDGISKDQIGASRSRAMLAAGLVGLAFLAAAAALILTGAGHGTARADQNDYHLPVIRQFAAQLPRPDLSDYNAAMTPGYHLVMAAVARYGHAGELGLRLASSLFTLGLLLTFFYFLSRYLGAEWGIVLSLPTLFAICFYGRRLAGAAQCGLVVCFNLPADLPSAGRRLEIIHCSGDGLAAARALPADSHLGRRTAVRCGVDGR